MQRQSILIAASIKLNTSNYKYKKVLRLFHLQSWNLYIVLMWQVGLFKLHRGRVAVAHSVGDRAGSGCRP